MPLWGNTDGANKKPKSPKTRNVREVLQFYTANTTVAGNTSITLVYADGGANNIANIGAAAGQFVYFYPNGPASVDGTGNGYAGMFASNNTIASVNTNTVILTNALFNTLNAAALIEFDKGIVYPTGEVSNTYNQDVILITPSRMANVNTSIANTGSLNSGWTHFRKKTNNDGTVRYIKETLVCLANPVASNTLSGNTSFGQIASGV